MGQTNGIKSRGGKIAEGSTVVAADLKKKSVYIDSRGNQVDPVTKQIIKRKDEDDPK